METIKNFLERITGHVWYEANSSNIVCYTWEEKTQNLYVLFKNGVTNILSKNGEIQNPMIVYGYHHISKSEFESLCQAESKGKWVNRNLVKTKKDYDKYEIILD